MTIIKQGFLLLAPAMLLIGCGRAQTPPSGTADGGSPAAVAAAAPMQPEPMGTDPDFAKRFEPMQVPSDIPSRDVRTPPAGSDD